MANVVNLYGSAASIPLDELASMSKAQLIQCATILHSALASANKTKFTTERELAMLKADVAGAPRGALGGAAGQMQTICELEGKCAAMEHAMRAAQDTVKRVAGENGDLKRLMCLTNVGPGRNSDAWAQVDTEIVPPTPPLAVPAAAALSLPPAEAATPKFAPTSPPHSPLQPPAQAPSGALSPSPSIIVVSSKTGKGAGTVIGDGAHSVAAVGSAAAAASPSAMASPISLEKVTSMNGATAAAAAGKKDDGAEQRAAAADNNSNNNKENDHELGDSASSRSRTPPTPVAAAPAAVKYSTKMDAGRNPSTTNAYKELQGSRVRIAALEDEIARLKGELLEQARLLRLREPVEVQYLKKMNGTLTKQTGEDRERILELQHEIATLKHELRRSGDENEATAIELALAAAGVTEDEAAAAAIAAIDGSKPTTAAKKAADTFETTAAKVAAIRKQASNRFGSTSTFDARLSSASSFSSNNGNGAGHNAGRRRSGAGGLTFVETTFADAEAQTDTQTTAKLVEICRQQTQELRDARMELLAAQETSKVQLDQIKELRRDNAGLVAEMKKMSALVAEMQAQLKQERSNRVRSQLNEPIGGGSMATSAAASAASSFNPAQRSTFPGMTPAARNSFLA